jgi:hypothetical protein
MGSFYGFSSNTIKSGLLELDYLETAGPRIVALRFDGSENLFAEVPQLATATPFGDFHYLGGHRLWHAPEAMPRTYIPDDTGCSCQTIPNGVVLTGQTEVMSGIQKVIEILVDPTTNSVKLKHHLINHNAWEVKFAPWAITMFKHGGLVTLPFRDAGQTANGLLPDRNLILWPYAKINDSRLHLIDDCIELTAEKGNPIKFGTFNPSGWIRYDIDGITFTKTFQVQTGAELADLGCNAECYCDEDFVELESLGAISAIQPGEEATWVEKWELRRK